MARLYETKMEQYSRELKAFNAGVAPDPAPVPPRSTRRRSANVPPGGYVTNEDLVVFPRYQTPEQAVRKQVEAFKRTYRKIKSASGATF
jgi:hypothetical protein